VKESKGATATEAGLNSIIPSSPTSPGRGREQGSICPGKKGKQAACDKVLAGDGRREKQEVNTSGGFY